MKRPRAEQLALRAAARWYFRPMHPGSGGCSRLPFYCDPRQVGTFAVPSEELAAATDEALFRVLVTLSMYQALRDVVIMRQQRTLSRASMRVVADVGVVGRSTEQHACGALRNAAAFANGCDVFKRADSVDCASCPGLPCHVKDATVVFHRMGDMGKLPTSAWLLFWKDEGVRRVLAEVCRAESQPANRAVLLVERFASCRGDATSLA